MVLARSQPVTLSGLPPELAFCLRRICSQRLHFQGSGISGGDGNHGLPGASILSGLVDAMAAPVNLDVDFRKTKFNKLADRESCSSSYHEVVGLGMLEHQPHCFDIFGGVTPVPLCRQIAKSQNILFFSDNFGDALTDFFRDKISPPAW